MKKIAKCIILVMICLLFSSQIHAGKGGGGSPPTKTVKDIDDVYTNDRAIFSSQAQPILKRDITESFSKERFDKLFIQDDDILGNAQTINQFLENEGFRVRENRESNYYLLNIEELMDNGNLFSSNYWQTNPGMQEIMRLEKADLELDTNIKSLNDINKNLIIENQRICVQGGNMMSNLLYYRSENSNCYKSSDSECIAKFAEFPLFKTCNSLSNLEQNIDVSSLFSEYVMACNFNSNFATMPSINEEINFGYSYCTFKDLNSDNSDNTIIIGYGIGNPQLESSVDELNMDINTLFSNPSFTITNTGSVDVIVKDYEQKVIDLGNHITIGGDKYKYTNERLQDEFDSTYSSQYKLLAKLIGTEYIGSDFADKVSGNYLLVESKLPKTIEMKKYTITDNSQSYVAYLNEETQLYVIANFDVSLSTIFNNYNLGDSIRAQTSERLFFKKVENSITYTLKEESELLYYSSSGVGTGTTYPVYILRVDGVNTDFCDTYFGFYGYSTDSTLTYGDSISCKYNAGTSTVIISERVFSEQFSKDSEMGAAYILLRSIIFP